MSDRYDLVLGIASDFLAGTPDARNSTITRDGDYLIAGSWRARPSRGPIDTDLWDIWVGEPAGVPAWRYADPDTAAYRLAMAARRPALGEGVYLIERTVIHTMRRLYPMHTHLLSQIVPPYSVDGGPPTMGVLTRTLSVHSDRSISVSGFPGSPDGDYAQRGVMVDDAVEWLSLGPAVHSLASESGGDVLYGDYGGCAVTARGRTVLLTSTGFERNPGPSLVPMPSRRQAYGPQGAMDRCLLRWLRSGNVR